MSNKHTHGPWKIGTPGPNGCYTVGTHGGLMTAMIAHSICEPDQIETANANARLIAAAPELLEVLTEIHLSFGGGNVVTFDDEAMARIAAVIAKAGGNGQA